MLADRRRLRRGPCFTTYLPAPMHRYHLIVLGVTLVPLLIRYPSPPVVPSSKGMVMLAAVAAAQFLGQLMLNRGFQLMSATRGSAINVLQVCGSSCGMLHSCFPLCTHALAKCCQRMPRHAMPANHGLLLMVPACSLPLACRSSSHMCGTW